jgi:F-type H+-transporting ATPase subunit a
VSAQHGEATAEAGPATTELSEKDKVSKENKEFIDHHLLDAHDFTLMVEKKVIIRIFLFLLFFMITDFMLS